MGHSAVKDDQGEKIYGPDGKPVWKACQRPANRRQTKCNTHGSRAPQVKARVERDRQRAAAEKIMRKFAGPVDVDGPEVLLDSIKWTAGWVYWLRGLITDATENPSELVQRSTVSGKQEPSVWLDLLDRWQRNLVQVCSEAIKAGIEERRVRLAEQQGALVADVLRRIFGDPELGLTPEQAQAAPKVAARHLRALAS